MGRKIAATNGAGEAERIIADLGIPTIPVDPFKIAQDRGIVVQPKDSDAPGASGFLVKMGDQFGILYGTHIENDGFIRFTVAHELGHYFIPGHPAILFPNGSGKHASRSGFVCDEDCEVEADHFAATLLMPPALFTQETRKLRPGFSAIVALAKGFNTSITAAAIQYAKHTEHPVAVIVSQGRAVNYCFLSETLAEVRGVRGLRKGSTVPPRSTTDEFNRDSSNVRLAKSTEGCVLLDRWFDDAPALDFNEDVVGLGSYGRTLTVLFSEDVVSDDEGDEEDE